MARCILIDVLPCHRLAFRLWPNRNAMAVPARTAVGDNARRVDVGGVGTLGADHHEAVANRIGRTAGAAVQEGGAEGAVVRGPAAVSLMATDTSCLGPHRTGNTCRGGSVSFNQTVKGPYRSAIEGRSLAKSKGDSESTRRVFPNVSSSRFFRLLYSSNCFGHNSPVMDRGKEKTE